LQKENAGWIRNSVIAFVNESPENSLKLIDEKAWGEPIVGFSHGDDDLYKYFKKDIGDFYWEPKDIFNLTYPDTNTPENELTVISWVLPQTEMTKRMQRKEKEYPSYRWFLSRLHGEEFNLLVAAYVRDLLINAGYKAVAPIISPHWKNKKSEKYGYASTWSERHTAHACGLGTFGLSDGLITPVGKAMRCGSVIANIAAEVTERPYRQYNEYCRFYRSGSCMACAKRCPAKAINENGHDKIACVNYQSNQIREYAKKTYNLEMGGCGLCQVKVPCESRIPKIKK
jgi:epoxyqueuosine reductase